MPRDDFTRLADVGEKMNSRERAPSSNELKTQPKLRLQRFLLSDRNGRLALPEFPPDHSEV